MSRRPAIYHPYKPSTPFSSPAGFRLRDLLPRAQCFNFLQGPAGFTTTRSPDPSPLSSPVRGARGPEHDEDAPPTLRLADLFPDGFASPQRLSTPSPDPRPIPTPTTAPQAPPANDPFPLPRRKTTRGPKHLSFTKDARRRRSRALDAKRAAFRRKVADERHARRMGASRDAFTRLRDEAEALMTPEHMTREDRIFLKQLQRLDLDQKLSHDLELCRDRVEHAAAEAEERRRAHEARDAEAERLWREQGEEDALEAQQRTVDEFVRQNELCGEAHFRQAEEEAMREDERRQRAFQAAERMLREEQERRFREEQARKVEEEQRRRREAQRRRLREEIERREQEQRERQAREEKERRREQERRLREEIERIREARRVREEQERKLREEVERQRREAHERLLREELERLAREELEREARLRAEQARRATTEEQVRRCFAVYEGKWNELRTSTSLPPIDVCEVPWPVFGVVSSADKITHQDVRTFLFHPLRPGLEGKTTRDKVKTEVLRFHPDKFNTRIIPKIQQAQQTVAQEIAGVVARILTAIMTEEAEGN